MNLTGFAKDPRLLLFNIDFNGQHGSSSIDTGGLRNTVLSWGFNTLFLPQRPFPLRVYYRMSDFGARGDSFSEDTAYSTLGIDWTLSLPELPRFTVGYTRLGNSIRLPTSLFDVSYRQATWRFNAEDVWKGWNWGIGFHDYSNRLQSPSAFDLPSEFQEDSQVLGLHLRRSFWEQKAHFNLDTRSQWRDSFLPRQRMTKSSDTYSHANFRIAHTSSLSSNYFYSYSRVQLRSDVLVGIPVGDPGGVTLIEPPTFDSHYAGGRADYQLTDTIRLFEEIRYYQLTPPATEFEARKSLTESSSGVRYHGMWRGVDLDGSYIFRYHLMGTNFGNHTDSASNDLEGRVEWGTTRRIRLRGTLRYSKLNLVEQLGGFSDDRRVRLEAATDWLPLVRLRLSGERSRIELLNLSGDIKQKSTNLNLQLNHARLSLSLTRILGEGAGALFLGDVRLRRLISIRLPLEDLIATPLLDRTTRTTAANLVFRLNRNLDLSGYWRRESNFFALSDLGFRQAGLRARYRLAKFTFEGAFNSYQTEITTAAGLSGTDIERYYIRIARDFSVF